MRPPMICLYFGLLTRFKKEPLEDIIQKSQEQVFAVWHMTNYQDFKMITMKIGGSDIVGLMINSKTIPLGVRKSNYLEVLGVGKSGI